MCSMDTVWKKPTYQYLYEIEGRIGNSTVFDRNVRYRTHNFKLQIMLDVQTNDGTEES